MMHFIEDPEPPENNNFTFWILIVIFTILSLISIINLFTTFYN